MRGTSPISMAPTHCCSRAPNVYTQLLSRHQRIVSFKLISSKLIGNLIAPIARTQEINWCPFEFGIKSFHPTWLYSRDLFLQNRSTNAPSRTVLWLLSVPGLTSHRSGGVKALAMPTPPWTATPAPLATKTSKRWLRPPSSRDRRMPSWGLAEQCTSGKNDQRVRAYHGC